MPNHPSAVPTRQIQAAVLRRKGGPLRKETLQLEGPRDDEVLVRLVASGICRTDIDYCDEWYEEEEGGLVLGHEGAGVVEEVGREVRGFSPGDHVVLSYQLRALLGANFGEVLPFRRHQPGHGRCSKGRDDKGCAANQRSLTG